MKAYRLHAPSLDALRLEEEPIPEPGAGEVLVRIRAVSLNYKDLLFVKPPQEGGFALPRPTIPISDMAGEVVKTGHGVSQWAPGDRVTAMVISNWPTGIIPADASQRALGFGQDGVLCEYRSLVEQSLLRLPDAYSFEEGSTLPIAAVTAWNALEQASRGDTVLILGTGGVALFALQLAKALGARTIITSSSDAKLDRARALGADETVNYKTNTEWHKRALELTGGRGVDHVIETVSGSNLTQSVAATRIGGHVYLVGLQDKGLMDPYQIQFRAVTVRGIRVGSKAIFSEMLQLIERHRIKPVIDRVFSFDQAIPAYKHLKAAGHFGKIVIRVT